MYYVTQEQLAQILQALKKLPVRVDDFETADEWVGLYLAVAKIGEQPIPQKEEAKEESEEKEE